MSHTSLHPTGTLSKFPLLLPLSRAYLLPSPLTISEHRLTHSAVADDSPSSPPQHGQLICWLGLNHDNMPEFPSMLHYPHARAYSANLFSSVRVSFSFLHVSQALQLLQFPIWALNLSLSILLTGSRYFPCLPTPKPWVPASNWAQISFLCLAPQVLPSLIGSLTLSPCPLTFLYFQVSYLSPAIMSMLSWPLLYFCSVLTLSICISNSSITISCSTHFCSFLFLHMYLPLQDIYSLAPSDVSSLILNFDNFYITTNKLSL